jgi:TRAP-type C4-dicarboxylate transport system permease small subunit
MEEPGYLAPHETLPPRGPWGERLYQLSKAFALAGGLVFIALVAMSIVSIVGRKLFSVPVPGDIELMQMGTAVAGAALLPYCEMQGSHLHVDFFTARLSPTAKARLDAIAHALLALVAIVLAWRTAISAISTYESGETTVMLGWPVWWAVALIVPSLALFAVAGGYNSVEDFLASRRHGNRGRP